MKALKGKSISYLFTGTIEEQDVKCASNSSIKSCFKYQQLLEFIGCYSNESFDCVDVLSRMNYKETIKNIVLPAIDNINDDNDILMLKEIFANNVHADLFDEQFIFTMTQQSFENAIIAQNRQISFGSLKLLYTNILKQINIFAEKKQISLFDVTYSTVMKNWNHVFQFHNMNDIYNKNIECTKESCQAGAARRNRRRDTTLKMNDMSNKYPNFNTFNDNTKQQIAIQQYYHDEFDTIHYNLFHQNRSKQRECEQYNTETIINTERFAEQKDFSHQMIEMALLHTNTKRETLRDSNTIRTLDEEIKNRYKTNIGSYGFGIDHQHHHLGPCKGNDCLKTELLNSQYVSQNNWISTFAKAIQKYKLIIKDENFKAKQFDDNYNICRHDQMGLHNILVICFYTDFSKLCTSYRASYRRLENDKNNDDVRKRHKIFYYLSRMLFETIEFFGETMTNKDLVFHGLDKELLFDNFITHFNAPMSTTIVKESAINFAGRDGIILHLKNGNTDISENYNISKYQPNQPRYLDVNWISAHNLEKEWLFYGNSIIFQVVNIQHMRDRQGIQIPKNTLKQLNLLQKIIEQKDIEWEKVIKRSQQLAMKLQKTREMILEFMEYNNSTDEIDYLYEYLNNKVDNKFIENFTKWYKSAEYDRDSLIEDIGDQGDKIQSNFYQFLVTQNKEKYFDRIYELFKQQQQQQINQQDCPYWLKLFQNFCLAQ
eukprot:443229_1